MRFSKLLAFSLLALVLFGSEGCRKGPTTSKKNTKKIKKGKPIPCPIKDC